MRERRKSRRLFFFTIAAAFILISGCGDHSPVELTDLTFADRGLPDECTIVPVEAGEELPCGASNNPFISSDRTFLDCFSSFLFPEEISADVQAALFSVYMGTKNEVGLFGYEFGSQNIVDQAFTFVEEMVSGNEDRYAGFRNGRIIIFLWRDDVNDPCFEELKDFIS